MPTADDFSRGPDIEGMRLVLDHLPDAAAVYDREWRWRYLNGPARALLERAHIDPATLIGRNIWDVYPADERRAERLRVLEGDGPVTFEFAIPQFGMVLETRLVLIPGGILSLSRDITARRGLEEALTRENEDLDLERRRLRAVLDILPVGVWIADAGGALIDANPAGEEIWAGKLPMTPSPGDYHRDYRGWLAATGEPLGPGDWGMSKALERGEVTSGAEIDIACFDGTRKTILNYAAPIRNAQKDVIGGVALTVDITERKRTERLQQVVSEASSVLGTSLDPDSAFAALGDICVQRLADVVLVSELEADGEIRRRAARHRNPELQPLLDPLLEPEPGLTSQRDRSAFLVRGEPQLLQHIDRQALARLQATPAEQRLVTELGLASLMLLPLRVRDRSIGSVVLGTVVGGRPPFSGEDLELGTALAHRAALAIDNARLYQAANAASMAKSQFLATMSHELRTPLTAIIGYGELLLNEIWGPLTERQRQQLERIRVSAWHLVTIIDQILTFSRAEAGRETVQSKPVNLSQLVQETTAMLEPQALAKRLELRVTLPDRPVWLRTDPGKVRQILLNLAGNAVKFTDYGVVEIALEDGGDAIGVHIHDSGPGIPHTELERIFEPFTQLDQSNTRSQGGTGLGLTVSRRLARLLGGEVQVESRAGEGSLFRLTLPRLA